MKIRAMMYAVAAIAVLRSDADRRRATTLDDTGIAAISVDLLVPARDLEEQGDDHDDQPEVDDGQRRGLADVGALEDVHEHGGRRGVVAGLAVRHRPDDRERVED